MCRQPLRNLPRLLGGAVGVCILFSAHGQDASALLARHTVLQSQLAQNTFRRPLVIESTQTGSALKGDVYAVVSQPYPVVRPALQDMHNWCAILILHLNVKQCRTRGSGRQGTVEVALGRKFDQPLSETYPVVFSYRVVTSGPTYLLARLDADDGPMGTHNYRIVLETIPLNEGGSFLHLSYAYDFGLTARLALQAYLATIGRDKVGFSVVGRGADGAPVYVGNLRGVVERNTMRYYLAVEAFLGALALPQAEQPGKRLRDWFDSTERFPKQLRELTWEEYLAMKRKEMAR